MDRLSPTGLDRNGMLTCERMAVQLSRALALAALRVNDGETISAWAVQSVEEAVVRVHRRFPERGAFQRLAATTRAQAAKVLAALLQNRAA